MTMSAPFVEIELNLLHSASSPFPTAIWYDWRSPNCGVEPRLAKRSVERRRDFAATT